MGWLLFFDGDCAFCSRSVRRLVAYDKHRRISFAPLQGKLAAEWDFTKHAAATGGSVVLLREIDGMIFMKSAALIELAHALGGGWRVMALARFIPRFLRDWVYDRIANNRFRFAGKGDSCSLANPDVMRRLRE
jgi:predicted DCC family thiol-disulfide oxidoreductase YuxK